MDFLKDLASKLYGPIVRTRQFLYEQGFLRCRALENPVISIGNITVGGTGKTPLVLFLAQILKEIGYQPVVLSRGYKGETREQVLMVSDGKQVLCDARMCGDEPYLMARKLEGVPVIVGKDRYQAGRLIEDQYEKVIHLLDDGYQHLQLKRDLNVLVLDATDPFGGTKLLPAGRLREGLEALRRADSIIVTRSHIPFDLEALQQTIRRFNKVVPLHFFHHDATGIYDVQTGVSSELRDFWGKPVLALAGIGNPEVFLRDLTHYQMQILDEFIFADHHVYTQEDLHAALKRLPEVGAEAIVTTEKDAVRLEKLEFEERQIYALEIEAKPENLEEYRKEFLKDLELLQKHP